MPDKAWKKRERDVAQYFNGTRTPLSGGNGKVTRSDVIHDDLFIECKLRAKHTVVSLWDDTAKLAKNEGKTPVIALCEKNRPGFWIMVHSDDLKKIKDEDQRINLEKEGWAVFDFNKSTMPELWDRKTYSNKEAQSAINREMS